MKLENRVRARATIALGKIKEKIYIVRKCGWSVIRNASDTLGLAIDKAERVNVVDKLSVEGNSGKITSCGGSTSSSGGGASPGRHARALLPHTTPSHHTPCTQATRCQLIHTNKAIPKHECTQTQHSTDSNVGNLWREWRAYECLFNSNIIYVGRFRSRDVGTYLNFVYIS